MHTVLQQISTESWVPCCMMDGDELEIIARFCPVGFKLRHLIYAFIALQIVVKARSKYINVADKMCEFVDSFMLYMTTRLPNPHLSPENQAKVIPGSLVLLCSGPYVLSVQQRYRGSNTAHRSSFVPYSCTW